MTHVLVKGHDYAYGPGILPVWASDLLAWTVAVLILVPFAYFAYGTVRCDWRVNGKRCWRQQVWDGYRDGKLTCDEHKEPRSWLG